MSTADSLRRIQQSEREDGLQLSSKVKIKSLHGMMLRINCLVILSDKENVILPDSFGRMRNGKWYGWWMAGVQEN
jgi:hypothetical protein